MKLVREHIILESYSAGYSYTGGTRGYGYSGGRGFGGASNMGGPNMMYTYEIKPLNHTLEQKPSDFNTQVRSIQIGSKIRGNIIKSNANPTDKKAQGIVKKIVISGEGDLKYYVIQDQDTQKDVKIEPISAKLIEFDPVQNYDSSGRLQMKRDKYKNRKIT